MALVRYGGGIVGASGSIAGTVHARNRYGNYIRARTKPVNPNSTNQTYVRSTLAKLVQRWNTTLTSTMRTAWATYAAAIAMKNKLGEVIYCTGFNHYVRSNVIKNMYLGDYADAGPTDLSLPEKDPTFSIVCTVSTQKISVSFDVALPWWAETGGIMAVYQGQPQLATRNFFGGPWRHIGNVAHGVASPKDLNPQFTLTLGQKVWCYGRILRADGRLSEPFTTSVLVTA